jgi:hypothetical protein
VMAAVGSSGVTPADPTASHQLELGAFTFLKHV